MFTFPAKNTISSDPRQTRQPSVPNMPFDRVPNTSTFIPATSTSSLPPIQETAVSSVSDMFRYFEHLIVNLQAFKPPPSYSATDEGASVSLKYSKIDLT
jgi:hypothetical protein